MNPVQELVAMDVPVPEVLAQLSPAGLVEWNGAIERARVQRLAREVVELRAQTAAILAADKTKATSGLGPIVEHTSPPTVAVPEPAGGEEVAEPTPVAADEHREQAAGSIE